MATALSPEEIARSHRWHAVECNNLAWRLSELTQRTPAQDAEMLNAAHASAFHWSKVGTEVHSARAKMLLGHVHALLGHGDLALVYAQESYRYLVAHEPPDWELAFAHAVVGHAAYAAGEADLHRENFAKAEKLGAGIADLEDREIFFKTFRHIPTP
jgi:hypothetical protein